MKCSSPSLAFEILQLTLFIFLFGIMSSTLFNVVTMLGLSIIREDILTLYDEGFKDHSSLMYKEIASYGKYIEEHRRSQGAISKIDTMLLFSFSHVNSSFLAILLP